MTPALEDLVVQAGLAWALLLICGVVIVELTYPLLRERMGRAALSGDLRPVLVLCWAPVLLATVVLAGCYTPSLLAALGSFHDHCSLDGGHVHLCVEHAQASDIGYLSWVLGGVVLAWLVPGLWELATDLRRGWALERSLRGLSAASAAGAMVIDADLPMSVTTGLWSPKIFMTTALEAALSPDQRRAVLEHERCHARERHAFVKLVGVLGALVFRRSTRRALLGHLALACERRSDEAAAAATGDRLDVAAALLATRRAIRHRAPLGTVALHGAEGFEARIRRLTDGVDAPPIPAAKVASWVVGVAAFGLMVGHELHHGVETVTSLFLR